MHRAAKLEPLGHSHMKSIGPLIVAVLIAFFLMSAGLGGFIFTLFAAFGLFSLIMLVALIWTYSDSQAHSKKQSKESGNETNKA